MTCGIPCQAPSTPELAGLGYSNIQVHWPELPSVTEYQTRQRKVGATTWVNGNWNTEPTTHWDNLTPCTDYEIQVQARCGTQTTGFSPSLLFTTEGCGDPYCYSYGSSWDDWIQKVEFGGFKHTSGNDYGYGNFTALKAQVELGSSYPIKLTAGTNEDPKTVYWRVWIDFNQDGDFTEFNEMVLQLSGSNSAPFTGNINIPAGITPGTTRMRISMATFSFPFPCDQAFGEREVEDYSIEILPIPEISANPSNSIFRQGGGFAGVDVSANIAWNASTAASWLSIGNGAGMGSGSFSVTCSENTEIAPRSATIILSGNGLEVEITVEQEGAIPYLEASLLQLSFDPTGLPSQEITIEANVPWEATCAATWVTIGNGAGSGAGAFSVTCSENLDLSPRIATIILSGNGLEVEITVDQAGAVPFLEASYCNLDFDQSGQPEQAVMINGNVAWEASASANWINISSGNGTGDGAFQVSCAENLKPRSTHR
ncbi:MAG: hypothetical protein IPH04_09015 [Saprospirales bacterium]|nr:hypothetical protein [Saprospirales bacterium]